MMATDDSGRGPANLAGGEAGRPRGAGPGGGRRPGLRTLMGAMMFVQILSAVLYLASIAITLVGRSPFPWIVHELVEVGAAVGLLIGAGLGFMALRRSLRRTRVAEARLRAASGAFMDMLEERFAEWSLTPAERDVALFAIKGLSTPEIARVRNTSEGTVKAQTAAIYRKAGVTGRPQLLSVFIEELMSGPLEARKAHAEA